MSIRLTLTLVLSLGITVPAFAMNDGNGNIDLKDPQLDAYLLICPRPNPTSGPRSVSTLIREGAQELRAMENALIADELRVIEDARIANERAIDDALMAALTAYQMAAPANQKLEEQKK